MSATPEVRYFQHVEVGIIATIPAEDALAWSQPDPEWREVTVSPVVPQGAATPADEAALTGQQVYEENGWGGCEGAAWDRLAPATRDGWEFAARALAASPADEMAETRATQAYPYEHVGYSQPVPAGCSCDECHRTDIRREAYSAGLLAASPADADTAERPEMVRADDWHTGWVIPVEAFDRWNAGRLADTAERIAQALRDAARDIDLCDGLDPGDAYEYGPEARRWEVRAEDWLNARAARIAREHAATPPVAVTSEEG